VPATLPIFPIGMDGFVTSTEALSLTSVPTKMVVIGAGAIGLELGSVWARLGAEVTVIELLDQILPGMDSEISRRLRSILGKQGLQIVTGTRVLEHKKAGKSNSEEVTLLAEGSDGKKQQFAADVVLVAVGRRPYTEGLGLGDLGVKSGADGSS
jgi:dihydrolipoamide dehydrogenase